MRYTYSLQPHYAKATRPVLFTTADGKQWPVTIALILNWGIDTETDNAADGLLEWIQKAEKTGEASEVQLQLLALSSGVRYVTRKHSDFPYPDIYMFSPNYKEKGHYILLAKPSVYGD